MNSFKLTLIAASVGIANAVAPAISHAQMLEEVLVTATKRTEGLQDVPIAISVMTGEAISQRGLTSLEDLAVYMPNIHIAEASSGTQLFVRGIGSGVNYGFEQSVGTFIDGVYYGRGRSARGKFLDLERVEVLKGPQSTLFGKNTIAGAINITTAKPSEEFEGYLESNYVTELEGFGVTGMVTGPITDSLRGRLVARMYDDEGYVENKAADGDDGPQRDETYIRGALEWDAGADLLIGLKAEHGTFDVLGRQSTLSEANPVATGLYRAFGDAGFTPGFNRTTYDVGFPGQNQFDDTETNLFQVTADYAIGEHSLRSISAYTDYEFTNIIDTDSSPVAFLARGRTEEHEQLSQEFLLTSPSGQAFEYLAGVYYQTEELSNNRNTLVAFSALPPVEANILGRVGNPPSTAIDGNGFSAFSQDSDSWSVFVEGTWNITDTFRTTVGLRYSDEHKEVSKSGFVENTSGILPDALFEFLWGGPLNLANRHEYSLQRDETHTTGHINLQWDFSDAGMVYFNIANGFKAGGFDEDNALGRLDVAEFDDESVDSLELGAKLDLYDGRGRFNVALFSSNYDDVQVSTFDGNAAFVVGNAAKSKVTGIEADILFAVTESLTLSGAFAYLDATYDDFENAACNVDQILANVAATGSRACVQDLSGERLQFAPEYTANIGAEYVMMMTETLELSTGMDYNWSDDTVVANDLDANLIQDSVGLLSARVGVASSDGVWSVALIGKNLTDEDVFNWGNDVPLGGFGFDRTYFKHINPPRTFELTARYNF